MGLFKGMKNKKEMFFNTTCCMLAYFKLLSVVSETISKEWDRWLYVMNQVSCIRTLI